MRLRDVRFKLATLMIAIAVVAVLLALIMALQFEPEEVPPPIDPFNSIEMIGPVPTTSDRKVPRPVQELSPQPADIQGQNPK